MKTIYYPFKIIPQKLLKGIREHGLKPESISSYLCLKSQAEWRLNKRTLVIDPDVIPYVLSKKKELNYDMIVTDSVPLVILLPVRSKIQSFLNVIDYGGRMRSNFPKLKVHSLLQYSISTRIDITKDESECHGILPFSSEHHPFLSKVTADDDRMIESARLGLAIRTAIKNRLLDVSDELPDNVYIRGKRALGKLQYVKIKESQYVDDN